MIKITEATHEDIPVIQAIAHKTWRSTYANLLSKEQLEYMLSIIYATDTLQNAIKDGSQSFLLLSDRVGVQAFAGFGLRPDDDRVYKLHKLYVLPGNQGKGYGRKLIDEVTARIRSYGSVILDLNVKRDNPAKGFYEKLGFRIIREEDIPFGPYWLEDYVMRLEL